MLPPTAYRRGQLSEGADHAYPHRGMVATRLPPHRRTGRPAWRLVVARSSLGSAEAPRHSASQERIGGTEVDGGPARRQPSGTRRLAPGVPGPGEHARTVGAGSVTGPTGLTCQDTCTRVHTVHRVSTKSVAIQAIAASTTVLGRTLVYRDVLVGLLQCCLLYTSDAADERSSVDLGGRRIIKKKK